MLKSLKADLQKLANPEKAKIYQRFFKTGPGEYGEGDKFLGLTVPQSRTIAKKYKDLGFGDLKSLLKSPVHEERLIALLILIEQFKKADQKKQEVIYKFYLANTKYINNWDLVDLSASRIVGPYLEDKSKDVLKRLARSNSLWERRIAMISTGHYIWKGDHKWGLIIAEMLLKDDHDLIHKAVGWMLREIGKKSGEKVLTNFLDKYSTQMPRTMLRYAIERFPEEKRKYYLNLK
jgi:3-methyladenine DNA glycosylase AlkD